MNNVLAQYEYTSGSPLLSLTLNSPKRTANERVH